MILLVFSRVDRFSNNVYRRLENKLSLIRKQGTADLYRYRGTTLILLERELDLPFTEYLDNLAEQIGTELIVYISRHEMKNPKPLLTVHTPGNWESADYGGKPGHVSLSPAHVQSELLRTLRRLAEEMKLTQEYDVTLEATHHGPSLDKPAVFIEVGSTEREWHDERCIRLFEIIVENIEDIVNRARWSSNKVVVSIGDLHYSTITSHVLNQEFDVGHIVPKYVNIDENIVKMCIERTTPSPVEAIVHWKSLKKETRELVVEVLSRLKVGIIKRK